MEKSWIYRSIMGDDEPTPARPIPAVPIVDTREILDAPKRTDSLTRLLRIAERDAALKAVYPEVWAMMKDSTPQPQITLNTYSQTPLPEPTKIDPRGESPCECECRQCLAGACFDCQQTPCCEFSSIRILDELIPVDPEQHQEEMEQAAKRQRNRIAQDRITKHKRNVKPLVDTLKSDLWPRGKRVNPVLWENLLTAMASDVAKGLASY
jgi:hypothetical protein